MDDQKIRQAEKAWAPGHRAQLQSLLQDVLLRLEDINTELDTNDMHVDDLRLKVVALQRRAQEATQAAGTGRSIRAQALHLLADNSAPGASRATTVFRNPLAEGGNEAEEERSPARLGRCRSALDVLHDLQALL